MPTPTLAARAAFVLALLLVGFQPLVTPRAEAQGAATVDPVFGGASLGLSNLRAVAIQPDGKVLVGGNTPRGILRLNADGSLDPSFNANVRHTDPLDSGADLDAVVLQPDGKILIGGFFNEVNGVSRSRLARLNADGSLDSGFTVSVDVSAGFYGVIAVVVQSDGKILLGGEFDQVNGVPRSRLARLNANGSLDASFNASVGNLNPDLSITSVRALALQSDGKILLGGFFEQVNGVPREGIARLNPDGSLDAGFDGNAYGSEALALQPDGKVIVGSGSSGVTRLNADGSPDASFVPDIDGDVETVALQPDGKVLLGGDFDAATAETGNKLARLNADGGRDRGFAVTTGGGRFFDDVAVTLQPDGKIVAGGTFVEVNGVTRNSLARLNGDGTLDPGFEADVASGPNAGVGGFLPQADGKIVISGSFSQVNGVARDGIARLNADGTLDPAFVVKIKGTGGGGLGVGTLVAQPDGKLLLSGRFVEVNGIARNNVARLNADASLDLDFAPSTDDDILALVRQPDGKIVIAGTFTEVNGVTRGNIARLNADGSLDSTFNSSSVSGSILSDRPDASSTVFAVAVQADGMIVFSGDFTQVNGVARSSIARLNANGSLNSGFEPGPNAAHFIPRLAVQPDGKLVLGGLSFDRVNVSAVSYVARLNADGSPDPDFSVTADGSGVNTVAVQPDGKILLGGSFTHVNATERNFLARLNANGSLDASFDAGSGPDGLLLVVVPQPDGKVLLGGNFVSVNGVLRNYVARLVGDANRPTALVSVVSAGRERGGFLVSRVGGQPDSALTVTYRVGGEATGGIDYETLSGRISFSPSQRKMVIPLHPLPGANRNKKVKVFLDPGANGAYDAGKAQSKVFLSDLP